nr:hypothetical protein [Agrobacterium tumefaciens]
MFARIIKWSTASGYREIVTATDSLSSTSPNGPAPVALATGRCAVDTLDKVA